MCVCVLIFLITQEMKSVCEQDKEKINIREKIPNSTALLQMQRKKGNKRKFSSVFEPQNAPSIPLSRTPILRWLITPG